MEENREFKEGDVVSLRNSKGYVKEFDNEEVYNKLKAFGLVIHSIFETETIPSNKEYFGLNAIYRDLMEELELCIYGKKINVECGKNIKEESLEQKGGGKND